MELNYTAVIVEPRKHKAIEFVLNNVCECLSMNWNIVFFHGCNNEEYVKNIIDNSIIFENRVKLVNLNIDNLDLIEYSKLFATKSIIYEHIQTEIFLVFQTDSMIIKKNKDIINYFLEYDYVGAPWLITAYNLTKNCSYIGNGGFSLRRKSKMLEIIENVEWNSSNNFIESNYDNIYEDLYFCKKYNNIIVNKPEYNKALMFCVDEVYNEVAFACHKPWFHFHYQTFKTIYPEVEILKELQCVETNE